jgi:hypothetical protein
LIRDIKPRSPVDRLRPPSSQQELGAEFDVELVAAVVGMSRAFIARALGRPGTRPGRLSLAQVLTLLDVDEFQETFIPRSRVPKYLLEYSTTPVKPVPALRRSSQEVGNAKLIVGDARELLPTLEPGSVQCVVTSTPYWGMRVYDMHRDIQWADG